jgi:hypothetical protein
VFSGGRLPTFPYLPENIIRNLLITSVATGNYFGSLFLHKLNPSGMIRCVAIVRTDVFDERTTSIITVTRIGELGITLAVRVFRRVILLLVTANVVPSSPILVTLMLEAISSSETSVLRRVKRCNIPEDGILHSHRRGNLKPYILLLPTECLRICLYCRPRMFLTFITETRNWALF